MTTWHGPQRGVRALLTFALALAAFAVPGIASAQDAVAGAQLSWQQFGHQAQFDLDVAVQLFAPAPAIGSLLQPVPIDFGDGTTTTVSPVVTSASFTGTTNIDRANAHVTFFHTYTTYGTKPAVRATLCCRSPTLSDGNANTSIRLTTAVTLVDPANGPAAASPLMSAPPIIRCAPSLACTVAMGAVARDGSPISYRLATTAESAMNVAASGAVDPLTGVFTMTPPAGGARVQTQVIAQSASGSTSIEFVISANAAFTAPPTITSPACGTTVTFFIGVQLSFPVTVSGGSATTVFMSGAPAGAVLAPGAQPGTYSFDLIPSLGMPSTAMQFSAVSATGQSNCVVTFAPQVVRLQYISGVVRDFSKTQQDFAKPDGDAESVIVAPTLGADNKPVFAPNGTPATIASAASFNQWFNGTAAQVYSMTLTDQADPNHHLFSVTANPFYPIDNALGGNQGDAHNRYFTYEVHSFVSYTPGDTLTFTSADDMWVFIDRTKVADLGGVHSPTSVTVPMDDLRSGGHPLRVGVNYELAIFYAHRSVSHAPVIGLQLPEINRCDILPATTLPAIGLSDMSYKGSAVPAAGSALQLTHAGQATVTGGTAWAAHNGAPVLVPIGDGFQTEFDFKMSGPGEGFAFVLQTASPSAVGAEAGNLEYAGIDHSLAVEFDARQETFLSDPSYQHVAVQSLYEQQNSAVHDFTSATLGISLFDPAAPLTFDDGKSHHVRIEFRPGPAPTLADGTPAPAGTPRYSWMLVYFDPALVLPGATAVPVAQAQIDSNALDRALKSGAAYLGFTSSVGTTAAPTLTISNWTVQSVPPGFQSSALSAPPDALVGVLSNTAITTASKCSLPMFYGAWPFLFATTMTKGTHTVATTIADHGDGSYAVGYTPDVEGLWTLTSAIGSSPIAGAPAPVVVNAGTTLALLPITATIGQPATFTARLTRTYDAQPVSNASISFTIGAQPQTVTTDATGVAQASIAALPPGAVPVVAAYAGSAAAFLLPSSANATVTGLAMQTTLQYAGATTVNAGDPLAVSATLSAATGPIAGEPLTFTFCGLSVVSTTAPNGTANAALPAIPAQGCGPSLTVSYAGSATYLRTSTSSPIAVQVITSLSYAGAVSGIFGQPVIVAARLLGQPGNGGLGGQVVVFGLPGGSTTLATTDAGGLAQATVSGLGSGDRLIDVTFGGNAAAGLLPSHASGSVHIAPAATALSYSGGTTFTSGGSLALSATLRVGGVALDGRTVTFIIDGQSISAITAPSGAAVATLPNLVLGGGAHSVTATFAGDANYMAGAASATIAVSVRTAVTYLGPSTSGFGTPVTVGARVLGDPGGLPVAGEPVLFTGGALQLTGITDATGAAQVSFPALPLGNTSIALSFAGDPSAFWLSSASTGTIAIVDTRAPVIGSVSDRIAEATSASGAVVTFPTPAATDDADPAPAVTLTPASGSVFPLGATAVTVRAVDASGNASLVTFVVRVQDTMAPVLTLPGNIQLPAPGTATFAATAADLVDGTDAVVCTPASGSTFPAGATPVSCSAVDRAGNRRSGTFTVTAAAPPPPPPPDAPDGRMFGMGHLDEGSAHHHFAFRVSQRSNVDAGRFEYWLVTSARGSSRQDDDDEYGAGGDGDRDGCYGRDHRRAVSVFQATAITGVTFSDDPAFQPGSKNGKRKPTVDTVTIVGKGKWNGKAGYTFEAHATDQGEPGRHRDTFAIVVKDAHGVVVASVTDELGGGNIQSTRLK